MSIYDERKKFGPKLLDVSLYAPSSATIRENWQPTDFGLFHKPELVVQEYVIEDAESAQAWVTFPDSQQTIPVKEALAEALYLRVLDFGYDRDAIEAVATTFGKLGSGMFLGFEDGSQCANEGELKKTVIAESVDDWSFWLTTFKVDHLATQLAQSTELRAARSLLDEMIALLVGLSGRTAGRRSLHSSHDAFRLNERSSRAMRLEDWRAIGRKRLEDSLSAALDLYCDVTFSFSPSPTLQIRGRGLVACVTASFVLSLLPGSGNPVRCAGCGNWFVANHGKARHCSDSCKTLAYRKRRQSKEVRNDG